MLDQILKAIPGARLRPPASAEEIAAAESRLGIVLPDVLRRMYLACNGLSEPVGNASYLYPLMSEPGGTSLVEMTLFWWHGYREYFPNLDFTPFVFFGSSSSDYEWGMRIQGAPEIVAYHHHMEDEYEVVGTDVLELYRRDLASYADV